MGLVRYEVLSDGNEYTTLDLLQYTLDLKIRKGDPKHTDSMRRRFGKLFIGINSLGFIIILCLIFSLALLIGNYFKPFF